MIIALDYDRTFTRDPELWYHFILDCQRRGHKVVLVTMRRPDESVYENSAVLLPVMEVVYTSRSAKGRYLIMAGIEPDIWIDDDPLSIFQGKQS